MCASLFGGEQLTFTLELKLFKRIHGDDSKTQFMSPTQPNKIHSVPNKYRSYLGYAEVRDGKGNIVNGRVGLTFFGDISSLMDTEHCPKRRSHSDDDENCGCFIFSARVFTDFGVFEISPPHETHRECGVIAVNTRGFLPFDTSSEDPLERRRRLQSSLLCV